MKAKYIYIALLSVLGVVTTSCTEYDEAVDDFVVATPESVLVVDELNELGTLKSYINREEHPNFKLGATVNVDEFKSTGFVNSLMKENFDEIVAENEMKYKSVVGDDGTMNFESVDALVKSAEEAELGLYGHALCWHASNNTKYLKALIAPRLVEDPEVPQGVVRYTPVVGKTTSVKRVRRTIMRAATTGEEMILKGDFDSCNGDVNLSPANTYSGGFKAAFVDEAGKDGTTAMQYTVNDPIPAHTKIQFNKYVGGSTDLGNWVSSYDDVVPEGGADFVFSMDIMSDVDYTLGTVNFGKPNWQSQANVEPTNKELKANEWATITCEVNLTDVQFTGIDINITDFTGSVLTFDNVSLIRIDPNGGGEGGDSTKEWYNMLSNGDFEGLAPASVVAGNMASTDIVDDNGSKVLLVGNDQIRPNTWDAQVHFRIADDEPDMEAGKQYTLRFKVKSDNGSTVAGGQFQSTFGGYIGGASPDRFNTSTEWTEVEMVYTAVAKARSITFCMGDVVDNFYFDDCFLGYERDKEDGGEEPEEPEYRELTDEEKDEVISGAMDAWVKSMMEHTSYVKAWDVVNEPIQDEDPTKLRNGEDNETTGDNFYWSDYMGDTYVRDIVKMARTYGGEGLTLFVNEYGLCYNSAKLESLIKWISYWEEDGTTKIDGIGTQMHTSCSLDAAEQAKIEEGVVNMFNKLAATGKLIKISELDITVKAADGTEITANDMTYEAYITLAKYYQFVISKYFELIPAAQQYGINHWTVINNTEGWRSGFPAGLWASSHERILPYAGYVNALQEGAADFVFDAVKEIIESDEVVE